MNRRSPYPVLLVSLFLAVSVASAQPVRPEVNALSVTVNGSLTTRDVMEQFVTRETPAWIWIFLNEKIYSKIGAPRKFFDPALFRQDIAQVKGFLRDNGFFRSRVDTSLTFSADGRLVDILVSIEEGERSKIDSVRITGLESVPPEITAGLLSHLPLRVGDPYVKRAVMETQSAIMKGLMNSGYPTAALDSVALVRYASSNNVSVLLRFQTGPRTVVGTIQFDHTDSELDSIVMLRQLDLTSGDIFNEEKRVTSEQNLNRLGVFEFASVRKGAGTLGAERDTIPILISYRLLELREITPELLALNETGSGSFFSTGLGLSYRHRNLFGGAQNFSLSSSARANYIENLNVYRSLMQGLAEPSVFGKANAEAQLAFPYFFTNKTTATVTLSAEAEKQPQYDLNTLRSKLAFSTRLATYTLGITELSLERVDPNYRSSNGTGIRPDDSTKQFNLIESYTLQRDKTNNFFSPTEGFFHSISVEEAGVLNELAGGFGLPYSKYVKATLLMKQYVSPMAAQEDVFAMKMKAGYAYLYDAKNQTPVPLPRRYFAGGSLSVRGWKDRQLSDFGDTLKGGNMLLEGSFEVRHQLFPNGGKIFVLELPRFWSVAFLDYGNTWYAARDLTFSDVALAVGLGIRYETFVGPFRLDLAWRLYDPKRGDGRQWLTQQVFFRDSFMNIHLGIGHAF